MSGGDGEHDVPEELSELNRELADVERRVERRIDPGGIAFGVTLAMLVLIVTLILPWTGDAQGWEILAGSRTFGALPRLFTFTSLGFGLVASSLALATAVVGAGLDHGRRLRDLRDQRAVGDLVAADRRADRRHRPGDRDGARRGRGDRADGLLGADRGPPRLTRESRVSHGESASPHGESCVSTVVVRTVSRALRASQRVRTNRGRSRRPV